MSALRTMWERLLLVVCCMIAPAIFFHLSLSRQRADLTEQITREFLNDAGIDGVITEQELERYMFSLASIGEYNVGLSYTSYQTEPYYAYYGETELTEYFSLRNAKKELLPESELSPIEVTDIDKLFLQETSNAEVVADHSKNGMVSLPQGSTGGLEYSSVVTNQEVYVGEPLVSVLQVRQNGVSYLAVGDTMYATMSGEYDVPITMGGEYTGVFTHVIAWEREVMCSEGHTYACTKDVLELYKANGTWELCPYCAGYIEDITITPNNISVLVGTEASALPLDVVVTYMNGDTKTIPFTDLATNYDKQYAGEQLLTVSYCGTTKQVGTITTYCPNCIECGTMISNRNADDCSKYPLCNICLTKKPLFLGTCIKVVNDVDDKTIRDAIIADGKFIMERDAYISAAVSHTGKGILGTDKHTYYRMGVFVRRDGR